MTTVIPSSSATSVWAWNFRETGISLPYLACFWYSVTRTVTVDCIFVEVITPFLVLRILYRIIKLSEVSRYSSSSFFDEMYFFELTKRMFHFEWKEFCSETRESICFFCYGYNFFRRCSFFSNRSFRSSRRHSVLLGSKRKKRMRIYDWCLDWELCSSENKSFTRKYFWYTIDLK